MAFDGSGGFSRPVASYVFDTVISETDVNTEMDGIATAFNNTLTRDGQGKPSANISWNSKRLNDLASGAARTDAANIGQIQDSAFIWCGTAGGTKNAIELTPSPAITAYAAGQRFRFIAGGTSSDDAVTISISSLATKAGQIDGSALSASVFIEAGKLYEADYDGTQFQLTRLSPTLQSLGYAAVASANTFTADQTIQSADAGATVGPNLNLDRNSASPADNDVLGAVVFKGRDDGANATTYGQIQGVALDVTDATEDGQVEIQTQLAGTLATRVKVAGGLIVGSPTGSDPGAGKVNATEYQVNGTALITGGLADTQSSTITGGTAISFTSIPSGVNQIVMTLKGIRTNTDNTTLQIRLGTSGGYVATGYTGAAYDQVANTASSTGFNLTTATGYDQANEWSGVAILNHMGSNVWSLLAIGASTIPTAFNFYAAGLVTLGAELDRIELTTAGGTATFSTVTGLWVTSRK